VKQRPDNFSNRIGGSERKIGAAYKAMREAEAAADEAARQSSTTAYHKAIGNAVADVEQELADRLVRLAEETGMLWWVLGERSDLLDRATPSISSRTYALVAAIEAAERTQILPPPASMDALLQRALKPCRSAGPKKLRLSDYVDEGGTWRRDQLQRINAGDCAELVPITTALKKMEELADAAAVAKAVTRLCPGVKGDATLSPFEAARQFYNELVFLKALEAL
jgi:hypothetical protein